MLSAVVATGAALVLLRPWRLREVIVLTLAEVRGRCITLRCVRRGRCLRRPLRLLGRA